MKAKHYFQTAILLSFYFMGIVTVQGQTAQIDSFLTAQIDALHIPGLSVAIIEDGRVVTMKTYGKANIEYGIPTTSQTAFQLASVTKLLSATAVLTLVQEGKLDLNQKVRYYLPDLPVSWNTMKVIDLLAHQSGVADLLALQHNFGSIDLALDSAKAIGLEFDPGEKTVYSGGDYVVVMKLIETLTGLTFQEFLNKNLLERLGMEHTVFNNMTQDFIYRTYDVIPFASTTYVWNAQQNRQQIFSMMFPQWTYPAGGLYSSIEDLTKWIIALDNHLILKPEIADLLWTPAKLNNGSNSNFGVGWIVDKYNGEKVTGHSGGPALADVVRLPERKITVVVLTNQIELRPFLAMKIMDVYMKNQK
ncbi:MAG: serine hydrolase domain-containing protein [Mariniphaga sp.]